jgi:hypothetical protein
LTRVRPATTFGPPGTACGSLLFGQSTAVAAAAGSRRSISRSRAIGRSAGLRRFSAVVTATGKHDHKNHAPDASHKLAQRIGLKLSARKSAPTSVFSF